MNAVRRLTFVALALVLATCTAFHVSPAASFVRSTTAARHQATQTHHVPSSSTSSRAFSAAGANPRGVSMTAEGPPPRSSRSVQRVTAVAAATSVATLASSAVPAHAENFAQYFAQGVVGAINGPGILAVPIVLGFGLASAIAFFIYFFSQPREYDD